MSRPVPETPSEWRELLRGYSADYLRVATEAELARFDHVQRESRWLGYGPAARSAPTRADQPLAVPVPVP